MQQLSATLSQYGQPISSVVPKHGNSIKAIALFLLFISSQIFWSSLCAQTISDSIKNDNFFNVIRSGNSQDLEKTLNNGANPNATLKNYSALMAATLNGSIDEMKILIDHGANINYINKDSVNALWLAVPDWDKTKLLVNHGADVHQRTQGYSILVKLALMPGTIKIFQLLIDKGADPKKSADDNSLLYNAATSGDTNIISLLIRSGLKVNDTVSFGDYPINAAMTYRSFAALKMLVENGANVNVSTMGALLEAFDGITPLMFAALSNDKPSLFYLLDHGANPNLKNKRGLTALMLLQQSEIDDPEMTLALIRHGAIVSEKAKDGSDALYYSQKRGNTESVEILKKYANK